MGRIKSALEIAFERTESIKGDKAGADQFEAKRKGVRLANEFLEKEDGGAMLEETVKNEQDDLKANLTAGIFESLLSRISLPISRGDEKYLERVGNGLQSLIADRKFHSLYGQLQEAFSHYFEEIEQYDEAIREQYAPRLQQKEAELSKRLGQQVKIDPFQDPEFTAFYKKNMDALKQNYQTALEQVKGEAVQAFEKTKAF